MNKIKSLLLVVLIGWYLTACGLPLIDTHKDTATVTVSVDGISLLSIIPEVEAMVSTYEITLSRSGYSDRTDSGASGPFEFGDIEVGTWAVSVDALDAASAIIARGTDVIDVTLSGPNEVVVAVTPTQVGSGTLDLTITWPSGLIDGLGSASLTPQGVSPIDVTADFLVAGDSATYGTTRNAAVYLLDVSLKNTGVEVAHFVESVHLYDNVTTAETVTLDASEISSKPIAPDTPTLVGSDTDSVSLAWIDNSNVEEGYRVERATVGGGPYSTVSGDLGPNTTAYTDTGLDVATTYYYRVSAFNSFGQSDLSGVLAATTTENTGAATITIDFQNPENPAITFTGAVDEIARGEPLTVVASAGYLQYDWYLDGSTSDPALSAVDDRATIDTGTLGFGTHTVTLIVDDLYSGRFSFRVVN